MKPTEEEVKKFREDVLESLATASLDNVKWLQGCLFGLDYPNKEKKGELDDG